MKIKDNLNVFLEQVKNDIIHAKRYIKTIDEKDTEIDYDFSHIPSDKEYRIFITVKAKEKPILDDVEKEYLSAVIKPFKNSIKNIKKARQTQEDFEFIILGVNSIKKDVYEEVLFPFFEAGKMYKGMEVGKAYTLKELGLE